MALPEGAPLKSAHKVDWVEFAVANGLPSYEAWQMTLDDLVARFDVEPDAVEEVPPNWQDIGPGHSGPAPDAAPEPSEPQPDDVGPGHAPQTPEVPVKPVKRRSRKGA